MNFFKDPIKKALPIGRAFEFGIKKVYNWYMEFEFDINKNRANQEKHGIDFVEVQALWDDFDYLEIPAKTIDEPRSLVIGKIGNRIWAAVITYRSHKVRIISVRRARKEEVALYESE